MGKLEDKIIYKKIKDIIGEFQFFLNHPNKGFDILQTSQKIHDLLRQELLSYRREIEKEVEELAVDGLLTDGGHHKQWYLEKILKVIGVDLIKLRKELNTPNKKGDYWDWEDGIAP